MRSSRRWNARRRSDGGAVRSRSRRRSSRWWKATSLPARRSVSMAVGTSNSSRALHRHVRRFDLIRLNLLLRRTALDLPCLHIELRAMPRALDDAADQDAVRERAAPVRAPILKRGVTALRPCDDEALVVDVYELHLVHAERRRGGRQRARAAVLARFLLPLPRARVAMIDANLIAEGKRAAHPAADGDRGGSERLERQG